MRLFIVFNVKKYKSLYPTMRFYKEGIIPLLDRLKFNRSFLFSIFLCLCKIRIRNGIWLSFHTLACVLRESKNSFEDKSQLIVCIKKIITSFLIQFWGRFSRHFLRYVPCTKTCKKTAIIQKSCMIIILAKRLWTDTVMYTK